MRHHSHTNIVLILLNQIEIGFYGSPIFEVFMAGLLCKVKSQGSL